MAKGGRGGKRAGGSSKSKKPMSVYDAKNMNELRTVLADRGISLSKDVDDLKFHEVRDAVSGALYVMEEFGVEGYLKEFSTGKGGVMSASLSGNIYFNKKYFKEGTEDLSVVMNGSSNFHPKNQNAFTTASHEAGHILESYIIKKELGITSNSNVSFLTQIDMVESWNKSKYSSKIISEACRSAKKEYKKQYGKTTTNASLIANVSGYATKNKSECFAECIADYVANGDNASILAKEVWNYTKKYFNK